MQSPLQLEVAPPSHRKAQASLTSDKDVKRARLISLQNGSGVSLPSLPKTPTSTSFVQIGAKMPQKGFAGLGAPNG